jgi:threonine aldolase
MKEEVYEDDPTDAVLQGLNQKTFDTCQDLTRITGTVGQQIL